MKVLVGDQDFGLLRNALRCSESHSYSAQPVSLFKSMQGSCSASANNLKSRLVPHRFLLTLTNKHLRRCAYLHLFDLLAG
eukprot:811217-Amphidinium_carterae.2